ncbi:hypothetical protein YDYSG_66860 [Paenibacillus tyrfis]|nr:hypothetical protein YDYSG_66860 [Paenibacillus tyrfis]
MSFDITRPTSFAVHCNHPFRKFHVFNGNINYTFSITIMDKKEKLKLPIYKTERSVYYFIIDLVNYTFSI